MPTPLNKTFRIALDEAKSGLNYAFRAEKEKASATGALGPNGLFIALQVRAQEQADQLAGRLLDAAEAVMARQELDREAARSAADEVFDQFIQFVVQSYESENRLQSPARKVSAPPIHSSLFRLSRQRLSAGLDETMERAPLSKRLTQLFGKLRGAS